MTVMLKMLQILSNMILTEIKKLPTNIATKRKQKKRNKIKIIHQAVRMFTSWVTVW